MATEKGDSFYTWFNISEAQFIGSDGHLDINNDEYLLTTSVRQRGMSFADKRTQEVGKLEKLSSIIQSKDVGTINTKKMNKFMTLGAAALCAAI